MDMTPDVIRQMLADGESLTSIAQHFGVARSTVSRKLEKAKKQETPWWFDREQFIAQLRQHGTIEDIARANGYKPTASTLRGWSRRHNIELRTTSKGHPSYVEGPQQAPANNDLHKQIHDALQKKPTMSVEELADRFHVPPKEVRRSLELLANDGYRVSVDEATVELQKVPPARTNLHRSLLEGNEMTIGVVSDTHLSSNEEALSELHLAYDIFAERGITEVVHAGDWTCGNGIFRGQVSEIKNQTFEQQVEYLVENYPQREGIVTRGISGNHDIEGDFGRIGANPVVALANQRDDIEFLGDYSAWINYGPDDDNPCWMHLLHGKGGMSYSYSYKAQKLADGYRSERKPAILTVGHWHVRGAFEARGIQVLFPACFEWQSPFLTRLGLFPAVGFHILTMTVGDDGELVKMVPEYYRFVEGRIIQS